MSRQANSRAAGLLFEAVAALPVPKVKILDADLLLEGLSLLINEFVFFFFIVLAVTSDIIRNASLEDFDHDTNNHGEPDEGEDLEEEEGC